MGRYYRQFFSVKKGELLQLGNPLTLEDVTNARNLLKEHTVPKINTRSEYESLYFCVASQGLSFEKAVKFTQSLHSLSLEQLMSPEHMTKHVQTAPHILYPDRIPVAAQFVANYSRGITGLASDLILYPKDVREILMTDKKIAGIGAKTISFWYLCLTAGTELITLDRHVLTQAAGLGVTMEESHYKGRKRRDVLKPIPVVEGECLFDVNALREQKIAEAKAQSRDPYYPKAYIPGRTIPTGPKYDEYVEIEKELKEKLEPFKILHTDDVLDGSLVTSLLWGWGVRVSRGAVPEQAQFDTEQIVRFSSPYSGKND